MTEQLEGQEMMFGLDSCAGKTSTDADRAVPQKAQTLRRSSKKLSKSAMKKHPIFVLVSRTQDGQHPGATTLKMEAGASPIVPWMPSIGEPRRDDADFVWLPISTDQQHRKYYLTLNCGVSPREPNPTKLNMVLEESESVSDHYRLSAKACLGILTRAERRGKVLPPELKEALENQAYSESTSKEERAEQTTRRTSLRRSQATATEPLTPSVSKKEPESLEEEKES